MREGKEDEKLSSPMFPRLHVNDTEKGGPRAPPRNKMALYEQFTIPTQRFSSGSASVTPFPSDSSVPSRSSSQIIGRKRDVYSLFSKSCTQSHQVEKLNSNTSRRMQDNMTANNEQKSVKTNEIATGPSSSSSPQCNSFGKNKFSNLKKFSSKNTRPKDDSSVSASEQAEKDVHNYDRERMSSSPISSASCRIAYEPQTYIAVIDLKSRKYVGNEAEENRKFTKAIPDPVEIPKFFPSARDEALVEANTCHDSEKEIQPHPSLAKENRSLISNSDRLYSGNTRIYQECLSEQNTEALKGKLGCTQVPALENSSTVIRESCSVLSPRDGDRNFDNLDNCSRPSESKKCATVHLRDVDRYEDDSDDSMVDSVSALNISPDLVVGAIGVKQFWKARKAIVHQQRIFAVQVFELHRLLKVQRLIAGSPHMLLEDYLNKPQTASSVKNKPTECAQPPLPSATLKDNYQRPNLHNECADKNPLGKIPLPSFNKDNGKLHGTRQTRYEFYLKNMPKHPVATATKSESCCSNPTAGNQWIFPMMSPSEGLIYKPYTGPCPPNAGFTAEMYGNCGSVGLNTGWGDFYTAAYAIPASHQQGVGFYPGTIPLNQAFFPPFVPPVTNQSMSGSVTDRTILFARVKSNGQENQLSTGDVNYLTHSQNLRDMSSQVSHPMPFRVRRFHGSKGSELQGSTASSPSERGNRDMLPLFPIEPAAEESSQNAESSELKSRAIKVVPHNPRSATESAARIFQLIQQERKQL